ncbi:restriction endonuclease subunit M [Deinococcus aerolatus]|uniref:Restriction endonuclease subunit M n=2 Tax=Deinococcus aerolatus TaxID=522487 RepID=A0ABQ2GGI6_9DEIO|nr:restriction endonuclease subunit M [Deinococcus aerolatus]
MLSLAAAGCVPDCGPMTRKAKAATPAPTLQRKLFLGDNLKVLRADIPDESVDLVYLDPPFNSAADYNVLFRDQGDQQDSAQILAFTDTWKWGPDDDQLLLELSQINGELARFLTDTVTRLGRNDLSAYLVMMTARLVELRRVLKPTGSLYLHCDPTASHYLKTVLDVLFGPQNFRNEITWKRSTAHSDTKQGRKGYGNIADIILYYTVSDEFAFNPVYTDYSVEQLAKYNQVDADGRKYTLDNITGPGGASNGNPSYEVMGVVRFWRYSKERMQALIDEGRIVQPRPGAVPRYKRYLDEMPGVPLQNVWDDIPPLNSQAQERLGYPTQKPLALLERIVSVSSNPGDVVLDPFCGCGTTVCAAEKLGRNWVGIDITHLSVALIKARLRRDFALEAGDYQEEGTPTTVDGGQYLFEQDAFQFQFWILGEIGAQPFGASAGNKKGKKGADGGIDGQMFFVKPDRSKVEKVIVSVKGGKNLTAGMVRDLAGVLTKEDAAIGIFVCLAKPTAGVLKEAAQQGGYEYGGKMFARVQVLTVEQILGGQQPDIPKGAVNVSYEQKAQKTLATESKKKGMTSLF